MSEILQKYESFIQTRKAIFFLIAVFLLIQISSFPAMLDMNLEQIENTVFVRVFLTIPPEEEVSGIQLDYGYDTQNWAFVSAFPAESLLTSNKQFQIATVYGILKVLIIGFNNYPIPGGELFTLQFNALSEGANPSGFNILQAKLSSPQAKPVSGTINNTNSSEVTESSADNNLEKEIPPSDTNNSSTSTETETNYPIDVKTPDTTTNITNIKPIIQEVTDTKTTLAYTNTSSTKSSNPTSSSGFVTNIGNPYIHDGNTHSQANKAENKVNIPKPMPIPERNIFWGKQYASGNNTVLIGSNTYTQNRSLTSYSENKGNHTPVPVFVKTTKKSSSPIMNATTENNSDIRAVSLNNTNKPSQNPYFALNISNVSPNRGRSNECTILETNTLKDNTLTTSNSLIIFVSITVLLLITLTSASTVIRKQTLFSRKK